jgi:3-oxoacyl-[acyl-carrier protein] reductase
VSEPAAAAARRALVLARCPDLGPAVAGALAAAGHRVVVAGDVPTPDGVQALSRAWPTGDEVDEVVADAVARLGGSVEVLVSVADHGLAQSLVRSRPGASQQEVVEQLVTVVRAVEVVAPDMAAARWGRVVLVGGMESLRGAGWRSAHAAAMAGLLGLARSAARELGPRGVTANVVAPGIVDTAHVHEARAAGGRGARTIDELTAATPLRRRGSAQEVAEAVCFLAGEGASYVTGALVPVDGGLGMGRI